MTTSNHVNSLICISSFNVFEDTLSPYRTFEKNDSKEDLGFAFELTRQLIEEKENALILRFEKCTK